MNNQKKELNYKMQTKVNAIFLIIALLIVFWLNLNPEVQTNEIKTISGTLSKKPQFTSGRNSSLIIYLKEYKVSFCTDQYSYPVLKKNKLKSEVKVGDKIYITIKIDGSTTFIEMLNKKLGIIAIIGLKTSKENYISVKDYNAEKSKDQKFLYLFWFCFLIYYFYWIFKNRKAIAEDKYPWFKND